MCTLTKVCFLYAVRGGRDGAAEEKASQKLTWANRGDFDSRATIKGAEELNLWCGAAVDVTQARSGCDEAHLLHFS